MALRFRAGELEFNATVAEASESPSPRTGDPLRTLTIQFRAQKVPMHEQALVEAEQRRSGGLFSLGDADQPDVEWRVRSSSSSYVGTEPWGINHHVWRIEQIERLACTRLIIGAVSTAPDDIGDVSTAPDDIGDVSTAPHDIGGVSLEPYDYAEAVSEDGVVRLVARCAISPLELDTLSRMSGAVPVIRVGISDTPREMTIEYVWGERSGGFAVAIRCVDAGLEPRLTLDHAIPVDEALADLIAVLSAKGVLNNADVEALRRRRHAARRVANVDGWPLTQS